MTHEQTRRAVLRTLGATTAAVAGARVVRGVTRGGGDEPRTTAEEFRHETVDPAPPTERVGYCGTADLTGNGREDVVVAGKGPRTNLFLFGSRTSLPTVDRLRRRAGLAGPTAFWYENPGWERHPIAGIPHLAEGGVLGDVTGDGRADLILGQGIHYRQLLWLEQPTDPREPWSAHLITDDFEMYHDIAFADVDGDGDPEVLALSQRSEILFYYDVPADPFQSPWPRSNRHVLMRGTNTKGLTAIPDGDPGDVVAGNSIYRRTGDGWSRERFADGFEQPRVAVADLDGDGDREIVLSEGDSPALASGPGRLAWFDPPDWERHLLREDLYCPHSLAVADFTGDGRPDIFVGEMGLGENPDPELLLFRNRGGGRFEQRVVSRGLPTHEATVTDLTGDGRPDIVGKAYRPQRHVDVWYNQY